MPEGGYSVRISAELIVWHLSWMQSRADLVVLCGQLLPLLLLHACRIDIYEVVIDCIVSLALRTPIVQLLLAQHALW